MQHAEALCGRTVLIVHEDPFRRDYLADVLRAAGATVAEPACDADAARRRIGTTDADAMVLSRTTGGAATPALLAAARAHDMVTLIVQLAAPVDGVDAGPGPSPGVAVLTAPYGGFQVADALAGLLAAAGERPRLCGPALRGH